MFSLTTTATLKHTSPLPSSIPSSLAITHLHNHALLIKLDPEYTSHISLPTDPAQPDTKRYKVTDHMNALPAGLWDTTVTFEAEMTDLEDGVEWVIKAPLGLVQRTTWRCLRAEEGEGWALVEDVQITANRMLVGTVRGKCEENWKGAHGKFIQFLEGEKEAGRGEA